jgi:nucleotide-binding universal stress UspA family protein
MAAAVATAGTEALAQLGWPATPATVQADHGVWQALVAAAAEQDAAIVVTGTRGHSPMAAAMIGSVAEGLLRYAGRPVLLVPPERGQS